MKPAASKNISTFSVWILATRPRTLPAAVAPVVLGTAMAISERHFAFFPTMAALAVALLLQVGVNLANDYFDYRRGIDTEKRLGPVRVTQSGLLPPRRVKWAMVITLGSAALSGLYLITIGGWPVVVAGAASILAALAYSGGPFPLASHGLGDLFVFLFFGLVAVCGTYYVQALHLTGIVVLMGAIMGLLITTILVVNNLRDMDTDREAGKRTLAVMIGARWTRLEYTLLQASAYVVPIAIWLGGLASPWVLLPILSIPFAVSINRTIWRGPGGPLLNHVLARTAQLALVFSVLISGGLILSSLNIP